jgi:hypothetical protein
MIRISVSVLCISVDLAIAFCVALPCLVLPWLGLPCLALPCLVLPRLVLAGLVLSWLVLSWGCPGLSCLTHISMPYLSIDVLLSHKLLCCLVLSRCVDRRFLVLSCVWKCCLVRCVVLVPVLCSSCLVCCEPYHLVLTLEKRS